MVNLFSIFDPSSSILSTAWLVLLLAPAMFVNNIWNSFPPLKITNGTMVGKLNNEVKFSLGNAENGTEILIITLFVSILIINFTALYPQIFSPSSHLTVNLPLSLSFWLTLIVFGWTQNINHILSHLLPQGTPPMLISFIVIIELVSNVIRPITLCVRLTANLVAGHLLITLLGNALTSSSIPIFSAIVVAPLTLTILESAVAGIQAYVFITLITLYTTEIN